MNSADLYNKRIVIWGAGREGIAAAHFIRAGWPDAPLTFVDEGHGPLQLDGLNDLNIVRGHDKIAAALNNADILVKSPGVSLYHPLLEPLKQRRIPITSLMNLWFAAHRDAESPTRTICVTGTKGKSTTAALLNHALNRLGARSVLAGNIGTALTRQAAQDADIIVIEVSSYQAANFDGLCDLAVLTALYPEHLDWHQDLRRYYDDKLNLLRHAGIRIVGDQAAAAMREAGLAVGPALIAHRPDSLHARGNQIYDGEHRIGRIHNPHLARPHNLANVCLVLLALKQLGYDLTAAREALEDFAGLPHRQSELGEKNGVLYVDDSISTTPQSAIAAMQVYHGRPLALIAGGFDRGIDYAPLADYIRRQAVNCVVLMGPSGARIGALLADIAVPHRRTAASMAEAVGFAQAHTPAGGVILLSPAAPSYGLFKNFEERGDAFAVAAGFNPAADAS